MARKGFCLHEGGPGSAGDVEGREGPFDLGEVLESMDHPGGVEPVGVEGGAHEVDAVELLLDGGPAVPTSRGWNNREWAGDVVVRAASTRPPAVGIGGPVVPRDIVFIQVLYRPPRGCYPRLAAAIGQRYVCDSTA